MRSRAWDASGPEWWCRGGIRAPPGGPGYSSATASLGTVLRETHSSRSWLTMGPGQLPPGLRCPQNPAHPREGSGLPGPRQGHLGAWGTSVWRLRVPCPPAPPSPRWPGAPAPPPCPCGSPACRETPRASGARWPSWVLFLQWGRLLQEPPFSLGVSQGILGQQGWPPQRGHRGPQTLGCVNCLWPAAFYRGLPLSGPLL